MCVIYIYMIDILHTRYILCGGGVCMCQYPYYIWMNHWRWLLSDVKRIIVINRRQPPIITWNINSIYFQRTQQIQAIITGTNNVTSSIVYCRHNISHSTNYNQVVWRQGHFSNNVAVQLFTEHQTVIAFIHIWANLISYRNTINQ